VSPSDVWVASEQPDISCVACASCPELYTWCLSSRKKGIEINSQKRSSDESQTQITEKSGVMGILFFFMLCVSQLISKFRYDS